MGTFEKAPVAMSTLSTSLNFGGDTFQDDPTTRTSDALVFFGATGDLAYKKIFPALQAMVLHRDLNMPIIGVAFSNWNIEQLQNRARESIKTHYPAAVENDVAKLIKLLRYVDGDYRAADTFTKLRSELGDAKRPIHYLAIPPSL